MLQPAESLLRRKVTENLGSFVRCSLPESEMRAVVVTVAKVL
jgi:hypothetical protein